MMITESVFARLWDSIEGNTRDLKRNFVAKTQSKTRAGGKKEEKKIKYVEINAKLISSRKDIFVLCFRRAYFGF